MLTNSFSRCWFANSVNLGDEQFLQITPSTRVIISHEHFPCTPCNRAPSKLFQLNAKSKRSRNETTHETFDKPRPFLRVSWPVRKGDIQLLINFAISFITEINVLYRRETRWLPLLARAIDEFFIRTSIHGFDREKHKTFCTVDSLTCRECTGKA